MLHRELLVLLLQPGQGPAQLDELLLVLVCHLEPHRAQPLDLLARLGERGRLPVCMLAIRLAIDHRATLARRVILDDGVIRPVPAHAAAAAQVMIGNVATARLAFELLGRRALESGEGGDAVEGHVARLEAARAVAGVNDPRQVALAVSAERWRHKVNEKCRGSLLARRIDLVDLLLNRN